MAQQLTKRESDQFFQNRSLFIFGALVFLTLLIVGNLAFLQLVRGDAFRAQIDGQYLASSAHVFERGKIFFSSLRDGRVLAAGQELGYKLAINPQALDGDDLEFIYPILREYGYEKGKEQFENIVSRLRKKGNRYYEILHRIREDEYEKLHTILEGKSGKKYLLYPEKWRVYPLGKVASHTIGFLSHTQEGYRATYGLEKSYDRILRRNVEDRYQNFFALIFHSIQRGIREGFSFEGDLVTSIDPQVQIALEEELKGVQEKWNSQLTAGIVLDARNGEVVAMAAIPNFDPNDYSSYPISRFTNPLVSNRYEFGSVMKPLVMAIALDRGFVNADTSYFDHGSVQVGKYTIRNFDERGRGWVTMQDVLTQSLNTGMVFVAKKIPKPMFREYMTRYGLREKSGIDLPNDAKGLTKNLESKRDIEFANISFGQGIAVSPVSFVKAVSALANGGVPLQPHVGKKVRYLSGVDRTLQFPEQERVLKEETAGEITRMLVNVFDAYRRGKVKFPHYRIAAKTGTAQMVRKDGRGYDRNRHLHSFFAYFPAYEPRYLVFLYTVDPKGVKYSSQTLIDPFRELARFLIHYANIPPDR